ncbi:MAG: FG-GAP repeat protein [Planctomycetota bacterium JB042]
MNARPSSKFLLLVSALTGGPAVAGTVVAQGTFLTPDTNLARTLGRVAVDGDTMLVGYTDADDLGNDRGGVYVVERSSDGTWSQTGKLVPTSFNGLEFGSNLAISGDFAAVGDGSANSLNGGVWMFRRIAGTWSQTQFLSPPGGFGSPRVSFVAFSGADLIVGAPTQSQGIFTVGAVHFYRFDGLAWQHTDGPLLPADGGSGGFWGRGVAIDGDVAATSSPLHGLVYLLARAGVGQSWHQVQKLAPPGGASNEFGKEIALEGDLLVVGSPGDDEKAKNAGAVFVYRRQGPGQWDLQTKLMAADGAANDSFGASVALRNGRLVVGAQLDDAAVSDAGSAYVFERQGGDTWQQVAKLEHPAPDTGDFMGKHVALTADGKIAVTCPEDDDVAQGLGTVLLYDAEPLSSSVATLSLAQPGTAVLDVQAGPVNAGREYYVLGSLSGTTPGVPIPGGTLPLNHDAYWLFTYTNPNTSLLANSRGVLGAGGGAQAMFTLPPGLAPALAGLVVSHAFVAFDTSAGLDVTLISDPASVLLVP